MNKKKQVILENITLGKLVHGGQCIAQTEAGKTVFVWGGLPGELVDVRVTKKKSSYVEGIVSLVHEPSPDRIEPKEPLSYLSTSPWQIMTFESENEAKQAILAESFEREAVTNISWSDFNAGDQQYGYRNKNEFGFWGDDGGLHLAHYVRGTNGKQMVTESKLAAEPINQAARDVRDELMRLDVWGGKLKTLLIRSSQDRQAVAALFVKEKLDFSDFKLPASLKGIDVYYSDPKSPASVPTKKIYSLGDVTLTDKIDGVSIKYDVLSFFQVNIQVFKEALSQIKNQLQKIISARADIIHGDTKTSESGNESIVKIVDMYSGVGTIGLCVGATTLVESDDANIAMAKQNVSGTDKTVVHANAETALDHIDSEDVLIIDPPRAGLHRDVVEHIIDIKPKKIIYLSCNPSTQARDVSLLSEIYTIIYARGYNFFPRTPHIESLIVMEQK